jgi:hypothetical protein
MQMTQDSSSDHDMWPWSKKNEIVTTPHWKHILFTQLQKLIKSILLTTEKYHALKALVKTGFLL